MNERRHEMVLEKTYPSGADEWFCPMCGRRMIINWEPEFKRTLLEVGDNKAIHSASKGDLQSGSLPANVEDLLAPQEDSGPADEDPRLAPWRTWLDDVDFEHLWNDEDQ